MKKAIQTRAAAAPGGAYSQAMRVENLLFVAGQGPFHPDTGAIVGTSIEEQTEQTLANLEAILREAGCGLADLVKVSAYLHSFEDFDRYDAVYRARVPDPRPVRTTVGAVLGGELIEIDAVAAIPPGA
jgi:2-iminobutanoate/2-iminopropanoate deaminase